MQLIPESIAQFRTPDGSVIRLEDWIDKPIYSTCELLTGFTDRQVAAFTYSVGEEVSASANVTTRRTATEADTNVSIGGTAVSTEEILVFAVRAEPFEFTLGTPADASSAVVTGRAGQPIPSLNNIAILNSRLKLVLKVSQSVQIEEGFGYFNTGFGPFSLGTTSLAAAAGRSLGNHGFPSDEAVRYYRMPHLIGGTEKYQVELRNYTGDAVTFYDEASSPQALANSLHRVVIHLEGARKRPVV